MNRRKFLKRSISGATGALAAPYVLTSSALGDANRPAASERIAVGCVGLGFGWPIFLRSEVQSK